jgi:abhydrolase domain-containing protein 17
VLTVLLGVYLLAAALAWLFAERLIFQPQPASYEIASDLLMIPVGGGDSVAARWLPNPSARFAVLYSHGNAEDIGDLDPFLRRLRDSGFSVLAYDYRGYGRSSARAPTERRAYQDHEAAYRYLTGPLGVAPGRVIIHGRSLGGGVARELAARCPAAGLVLESTFTSTFRVVAPPLFPFDRFSTLRRLPRVRMPILVIHGSADRVVPMSHGRLLHAAAGAGARSLWVEGASHDDLPYVAGDGYFRALGDFARSLPEADASGRCAAEAGRD